MSLLRSTGLSIALIAAGLVSAFAQAPAPAPAPPPFATTKVDGTDGVYIFRNGGHQAMFIVTKDGVIATDPISLRRSAQTYIDEIKKVTDKPIKYVIYSHSHYDHIAGGEPFKKLGARFIAHKNTTARLKQLKPADVVIPDESTGDKKVISLGGTTLELLYVGKNHGDNTLVMRLPKEKIIFTVDWLPLQAVQFRVMADTYLPETFDGIKKVLAMDWDRMITGHPGPGGRQIGTKDDVKTTLSYLEDLSGAVKAQVDQGRSYDQAMEAIKLPKYEGLGGYGPFLKMNIERFYDFHNRGI
jgi:glyoxylase-like metal-dependent hydrolase (beta-lactamase superfamily II)